MSRAVLHFSCGKAGAGKSSLAAIDTADATCLARIAQRNVERPEGSHHLTPEQFAAISAFFEPPGADEGLVIRRHDPLA